MKFLCCHCGIESNVKEKDVVKKQRMLVTQEVVLKTRITCPVCRKETIVKATIRDPKFRFVEKFVGDRPKSSFERWETKTVLEPCDVEKAPQDEHDINFM